MKAQIEVLLSMWGRWAIRRESGALGFPAVSPMFRDAPKGDAFGSALPLGFGDADLVAVDAAVGRLPSALRLVVLEVYQRGGSLRDVGARMGISYKSVRAYLEVAHERVDGYLREAAERERAEKEEPLRHLSMSGA
jgi:hypothetical protein